MLFFYNCIKKNKDGNYLIIPVIAIWISLLIATPAFSEVRYIYAMFTCFPLIITESLLEEDTSDYTSFTDDGIKAIVL